MTVLKMADMALRGKRVLIREDLNVPIKHGQISDDTPIRAALPALQQALQVGARVIVMSHLGRPEEGVFSEENSLGPVARHLSGLLDREVPLTRDWLDGVDVESGELVLCENVRFNKGEKKNSDELAKRMAALCDIYVMEAFGIAYRAEASTHGVDQVRATRLRRPLLTAKLEALRRALDNPARYGTGDRISYISTGGGAFLEFLEGKQLPAVEVLQKRASDA